MVLNTTTADVRAIAAKAAPLHERWRGQPSSSFDAEAAEQRLRHWREALAVDDDAELFARRLALDSLDLEVCRRVLGGTTLGDDPLPAWAERFRVLLEHCRPLVWTDDEAPAAVPAATHDKPMPFDEAQVAHKQPPFVEVFASFVEAATAELCRRAGRKLERLSEAARAQFQKNLLGRLCGLSAMALSLEFRQFVARHDPLSMFRPAATADAPPSCTLYRRFVEDLLGGGLLGFFHDYPVLARLIAVVVEHWVEHVAEFCGRLDADFQALAATFNQGEDPGGLVAVKLGLSDPHNRGRSVIALTFASGLKVIYKPKDLGIDVAFFNLVDWLNARGCPLPLRTLRVVNRTTHGWVEFAEHEPLTDAEAARRYYRRVGMILCLVYALEGTDFHLENIIAAGEQPVLIDLETMLQAVIRPWDAAMDETADRRAIALLEASVLRNGLLPSWTSGGPGKSFDLSGLGGDESQDTGSRYPDWKHVNTDAMELEYKTWQMKPEANVPLLDGQPVSARAHLAEISEGFAAMYRLLLDRRDELRSIDGPLAACRGLKLRQVLRATRTYAMVARRLLHPEYLRGGLERGLELERLARPFLFVQSAPDRPVPWDMFHAEVAAMELLDIPFFNVMSDGTQLIAGGEVVAPGFFAESGLERVRARLGALSEADLAFQTGFIRAAMHVRWGQAPAQHEQQPGARQTSQIPLPEEPASRAELIAAALDLAGQIRASALRGNDGSATWFSLSVDPTNERLNLLPMGDNLYDGRLGVALFLAALEHVAEGAGFRELAQAALLPLRKALRQPVSFASAASSLGGCAGLGGQLYTLIRIGAWLGDEELPALARRLLDGFTPNRVARDESLDIVAGAAGGILGLLALSATGSNGAALERAVCCGDHLLAKRVVTECGNRVWPLAWATRPLTGFAHGAAGIACALARLGQATAEPRFLEAAREAVAYEAAQWSEAAGNWPDLRDQAPAPFMNAWCHGAAGIGLGRLAMPGSLDDPACRRDIERAVHVAQAATLQDVDHPCCGNFGRLDLLIEAGKRLDRPELIRSARRRAAALLQRRRQAGCFALHAHVPGVTTSSSFFQGLAGIGYQMLRLAEPRRLPCVLLLE